MAKILASSLGTVPTVAYGSVEKVKEKEKAAKLSEAKARSELDASNAALDDSKKQLSLQKEEEAKKISQASSESRRAALSNFLAKRGETLSSRRFLVGAR